MSRLWQALLHPKLAIRLQLIVATSLVCLFVLGAIAVVGSWDLMWDARLDKLRANTEQAISIASVFQRREQGGGLTREQAIQQYRDTIRPIRYDGGAGYYFAYTMDGKTLILGPSPEVEGTSRLGLTDSDGKLLIQEMIAVARQGGGMVAYRYPKPGSSDPQPKLVYVKPIPEWNMFVGTGLYVDDLRSATFAAAVRFGALAGVLILINALVAWVVVRGITGPLSRMRLSMVSLANGDLGVEIPGTGRKDEIGDMADAVSVFKEHMHQAAHLASEREADHRRSTEEKLAVLTRMADIIEAETSKAINRVGALTAAMTATAEAMSASAERTGASAQSAATASGQALGNAQSVASAAEQLSASIREISVQMGHSSEVIGRAVAAGSETRATIETLNEQVGRIGAVADMIGEIAARTNLLALNATIEAARAGEAGKGFAVVASEVKALASQTARSTQEISQHIGQIRNATGMSVAAVKRIEQTIGEISAIGGSIAAAVEEQGAATAEIAHIVSETATAANKMTDHANAVSTEAEQTGKRAVDVCRDATGLNRAVNDLRHTVIHAVRTSTAETNRRTATRYQVDLACRVNVPGQEAADARVTDLSEQGAGVRGGPTLGPDARCTLHIDGADVALPAIVRHSGNDMLNLRFELDETTAARFHPFVDRLARGRAA